MKNFARSLKNILFHLRKIARAIFYSDRKLTFLLIALTIYNLFFIDKAIHIDDSFVISIARSINRNMFRPEGFFSNPVLLGYYYAPIIRLFGENEVWLHLFSLPFSLAAVIAMYSLSKRFVGRTVLPVYSLIISPAFLVNSHNLMLDVPMLSFFLSAIACFVYGIDKNNKSILFLSGILAGVAILTKYSGLMLIPLMFIYSYIFSRKYNFSFLLIPIAIFLLWLGYDRICNHQFSFIQALLWRLKNIDIEQLTIRLWAALSFISGTSIVILFLMPFLLSRKSRAVLLFFCFCAAPVIFLMKETFTRYSLLEKGFLWVFFASSLFIIFLIGAHIFLFLSRKTHDKESLFLAIWFLVMLCFTVFIQFIAARFILLLFPPMFLFVYRGISASKASSAFLYKRTMPILLALAFFISALIARGDYHFANIYRDAVIRIKKYLPEGARAYFPRGSYSQYFTWGYSYYLSKYYPENKENLIYNAFQKAATVYFVSSESPVLPVVVIGNELSSKEALPFRGAKKELIARFSYEGNVFTHHYGNRVGFYAHDWGLLPFRVFFHKQLMESFALYRIVNN